MIRMPIGSGASRPHRTARDRRNGARNASESLPAIPRITHSGWQAVKGMLVTAAETRTGRAVEAATASLEKALENEGWLSR